MTLRALTNHPDKYIKMLITIIRDTEKINTVLQSPASVPTFFMLARSSFLNCNFETLSLVFIFNSANMRKIIPIKESMAAMQ